MRTALRNIFAFLCLVALLTIVFVSCDALPINPSPNGNNNQSQDHSHSFGEWTVTEEATCTKDGVRTCSCSCGEIKNESIEAKGHLYDGWYISIEAACETNGERRRKCSVCSESEVESIAAKGHDIGEWIISTEPTCTENGTRTRSCKSCEYMETEDIVASHVYENDYCIYCGASSEEFFVFTLREDDTYELAARDVGKMTSIVIIPATYKGKSVTAIGNGAFANCVNLIDITIPENISVIGEDAFLGCRGLENVYVNNLERWLTIEYGNDYSHPNTYGVLHIFENGKEINTVSIPKTVTSIGDYVFCNFTALYSITIGEGVTLIGNNAFSNCSYLRVINLPSSVISIGENAFLNCVSVNDLKIPDGISLISENAFQGCTAIKKVTLPTHAIAYVPKNSLKHVVITSGETIEADAFMNCNIYQLEIADSVINIGEQAFEGCNYIRHISIPAFALDHIYRKSLFSATITSGSSIPNNAFLNCYDLYSVVLPDSIETIGQSAFDGCGSLPSITIPKGLKTIGPKAFEDCDKLEDVYVKDVEAWMNIDFQLGYDINRYEVVIKYSSHPIHHYDGGTIHFLGEDGKELTEIVIPEGITTIPDFAFYNSESVTKVTIPATVTYVGYCSFSNTNIKDIYVKDIGAWLSMKYGVDYNKEDYKPLPFYWMDLHFVDQNNEELSEIVIPDGVTFIRDNIFRNAKNITSVVFPESVTSIQQVAFENCIALESITIPDNITQVARGAFANCKGLTEVSIGKGITHIDESIFKECTKITKIVIPDSVVSIGESAFAGCTNLADITVPDSVVSIGQDAFKYTAYCTDIGNRVDYATYIGNHLIEVDETVSGKYAVREGTVTISSHAFLRCSEITEIVIPDSVVFIGEDAFRGCQIEKATIPAIAAIHISSTYLKTVDITSGTTIEKNAFYDCYLLEEVNIADTVTHIEKDAFYNCGKLYTLVIPDSVTYIHHEAFNKCFIRNLSGPSNVMGGIDKTYLISLTITSGDSIYEGTFAGLEKLQSVTINAEIVSIGEGAFENCYILKKVNIPDSVLHIGKNAFANCSIESISLSDNIESIGEGAFKRCGLKYVSVPAKALPFVNDKSIEKLVITSGTVIEDDALIMCEKITSITLPSTIETIGKNAFYGCSVSLEEIIVDDNNVNYSDEGNCLIDTRSNTVILGCKNSVIPETVTSINEAAFWGCVGLSEINLPDGIISIGKRAFYNCSDLTGISIPDSVSIIGSSAFANCKALVDVVFGEGLTTIEKGAFDNCESIQSISLPASVTSIDKSAFDFCTSVMSVHVDADNPNYYSKDNCLIERSTETLVKGFNAASVPEGVLVIGDSAFMHSTVLDELVLPDSVTKIGMGAFAGSSLSKITFGNSVQIIEESAFSYCGELKEIFIPKTVKHIGDGAFQGCPSLSTITVEHIPEYVGSSLFLWTPVEIANVPTTLLSELPKESIKTVTINSGTEISVRILSGCSQLESVTISASVEFIGHYALTSCPKLTSVVFEDPEGWLEAHYLYPSNGDEIPSEELADPTVASQRISGNYNYDWYKESDQ